MAIRQFADVSKFQALNAAIYAASTGPVWAPIVVINFDGNPNAFQQWQDAGKAGMVRGAYCFASPGEDGKSDVDKMLAFLHQAGGWRPADFPVLDVETPGGGGWANSYVQSACAEAARRWRAGWLYCGGPYAREQGIVWPGGGWRWWPAAYPGPPEKPDASWPDPVAHQFTGSGAAPGVTPLPDVPGVDLSWLFDETVLPTPGPTPLPTPEDLMSGHVVLVVPKDEGGKQYALWHDPAAGFVRQWLPGVPQETVCFATGAFADQKVGVPVPVDTLRGIPIVGAP